MNSSKITVEVSIHAKLDKVWDYWTNPKHIVNWYNASEDWHAPYADNDLKENGKFKTTMAAKDGSFSFDFEGIYTHIETHQKIEYVLGDQRKVAVLFETNNHEVKVTEIFDPEEINPIDMQKAGWLAILTNFKKYVEAN